MNAPELKKLFVDFFVSKGHVEIPSASLLPENDPTTLFISAGMQPLVPYFTGQPHPSGNRIVDVQKCVRTGDIDEVGDSFHHTFFEMLGNWSLGDYFKKEAIEFSYEFLTKHLKLDKSKLSVTCFAGNSDSPKDDEAASIWQACGIPKEKINYLTDNWWGPAGNTGPCGTDTEMFFNGLEIWNDVLIQYLKNDQGKFEKLIQNNIDTGMGVERTLAVISGFDDDYLTSIWQPIIKKIEEISGKIYSENLISMRIIADHLRASVFIMADGLEPSNKEAGYILRRLIRRSIRQGKLLGINTNFTKVIAQAVLDNQHNYAGVYPELNDNKNKILEILDAEENKFRKTLDKGLEQFKKEIKNKKRIGYKTSKTPNDFGRLAFYFYESYGFPFELFLEEIKTSGFVTDPEAMKKSFEEAKTEHIKQSQTLSAGKFKSGLADHSEIITKYHTATHLLHASLRKILGEHVQQSGSNITSERLRFDFSHSEKLTPEQISQIETMINDQINKSLVVKMETMKFIDAQKAGALAFFGTKYPETVSVYSMGDFSKEVCTGPHVKNTNTLGVFKIEKEESAGSGKRRIYAILN